MKISLDWLNYGDNSSPEIAATICSWAIDVGGLNVSKFARQGHDQAPEHMITSCYPIAEGIAKSWWFLLSSSSGMLPLKKYREGFVFPDIVLEPTGDRVEISARTFRYQNPPIAFVNASQEIVEISELEAQFGKFIEDVIARLSDFSIDDSGLHRRWNWIMKSTLDEEERAFCEAAGALGVDPYTCTDDDAKALSDASIYFTGEHLRDFLSGEQQEYEKSSLADSVEYDLKWLAGQQYSLKKAAELPELAEIAKNFKLISESTIPYVKGYRAAKQLRSMMGISDEEKYHNITSIGQKLGNANFASSNEKAKRLKGVVDSNAAIPKIFLDDIRRDDSKAFALVRGIGDYLIFEKTGNAPLTDARSNRQAAGRAFAAEFLAPVHRIIHMSQDGWSNSELAREFGVDERVITHQLENSTNYSDN